MVIDQGTLLDRIDYNVEQTAVHLQDAVYELDEVLESETHHTLKTHGYNFTMRISLVNNNACLSAVTDAIGRKIPKED